MTFKPSSIHKFFFTYICPRFYGGSPPSAPSNTTSTVTQNSIPAELMPYATGMLSAASNQLYTKDASGNITGYQPYKPYSTNAQDYVAPFSSMQQQAQTSAAGLQTPGQFAPASQMAGISGLGSMMAGQNYQNQATNPNSISAYMSPYMQNVVQQQQREANRTYDISAAKQQGAATQAGAFGGSREALMAAENERNRNMELANIQATGTQNAFQNAQQAQQFGATTGLAGYGQGIQGAQAMGQLGTSQLAAQQGVIGTQSTMGGQQQAQNQAAIDQAVLNYQNEQQQPYLAAGTMSSLIRGTPTGNLTTQNYQAQPSALTQIGGALGTAGSLYGAATAKAKGGIIQAYAGGGSVEGNIESQLQDMDDNQLQQIMNSSPSESIKGIAKRILAEHAVEGRANGGIIGYANGGAPEKLTDAQIKQIEVETGMPYNLKEGIKQLPTELPAPMAKSIAARGIEAKTKDYLNSGIQSAIPEEEAVETAPDNEVVEQPTQDLNAELGAREVRKGIQGAGMTTDVESNAAQEVAPRSSEGILSAYKKEHEASPQTQEDRAIAAQSERELMDAEVEAQKAAGIETSQEASAAERKQIMDERANAGVEQKRQMYLRMGEFFANWGSTPGAPLAAGLKAMKDVLPGVMEDTKAHRKLLQDINKSENDLNHAVRLEQLGLWEKAGTKKDAASARLTKWGDDIATLGVKVTQQTEELAAAQKRTETSAGASMYGADVRAVSEEAQVAKSNASEVRTMLNSTRQLRDDIKQLHKLKGDAVDDAELKDIVDQIQAKEGEIKLYNDQIKSLQHIGLPQVREQFIPPSPDDPVAKQRTIAALRAKKGV
jgi:hypothetical protein